MIDLTSTQFLIIFLHFLTNGHNNDLFFPDCEVKNADDTKCLHDKLVLTRVDSVYVSANAVRCLVVARLTPGPHTVTTFIRPKSRKYTQPVDQTKCVCKMVRVDGGWNRQPYVLRATLVGNFCRGKEQWISFFCLVYTNFAALPPIFCSLHLLKEGQEGW